MTAAPRDPYEWFSASSLDALPGAPQVEPTRPPYYPAVDGSPTEFARWVRRMEVVMSTPDNSLSGVWAHLTRRARVLDRAVRRVVGDTSKLRYWAQGRVLMHSDVQAVRAEFQRLWREG